MKNCNLCGLEVELINVPGDIIEYNCRRCGHVRMTGRMSSVFINNRAYDKYKSTFSGITRYILEYDLPMITISSNVLQKIEDPSLLDYYFVPRNISDKVNLLLRYFEKKSNHPGERVSIDAALDYPVVFANKPNELRFYLAQLVRNGLISDEGSYDYTLLMDGWSRLDELNRETIKKNQAFIAMWFDPTMSDVYENGLRKAVTDCNYQPMKIDLKEHNNKIDDEIIAEIRNSGFLVADMTGNRGGVYFEAGFAMGLGVPVIWTCKKDEIGNLHFDTRQFNHIEWETAEELCKKLTNRIKATITIRNE